MLTIRYCEKGKKAREWNDVCVQSRPHHDKDRRDSHAKWSRLGSRPLTRPLTARAMADRLSVQQISNYDTPSKTWSLGITVLLTLLTYSINVITWKLRGGGGEGDTALMVSRSTLSDSSSSSWQLLYSAADSVCLTYRPWLITCC